MSDCYGIPVLGEHGPKARGDDEQSVAATAPESAEDTERRSERATTYETFHLCLRCSHAQVCGIVSAARALGAENDIVISVCGAYEEAKPPLMSIDETDVGKLAP